jgi:hypothetical protein
VNGWEKMACDETNDFTESVEGYQCHGTWKRAQCFETGSNLRHRRGITKLREQFAESLSVTRFCPSDHPRGYCFAGSALNSFTRNAQVMSFPA